MRASIITAIMSRFPRAGLEPTHLPFLGGHRSWPLFCLDSLGTWTLVLWHMIQSHYHFTEQAIACPILWMPITKYQMKTANLIWFWVALNYFWREERMAESVKCLLPMREVVRSILIYSLTFDIIRVKEVHGSVTWGGHVLVYWQDTPMGRHYKVSVSRSTSRAHLLCC